RHKRAVRMLLLHLGLHSADAITAPSLEQFANVLNRIRSNQTMASSSTNFAKTRDAVMVFIRGPQGHEAPIPLAGSVHEHRPI
ncbi:MAG: hypothetical protein ACKPKO_38635, partial [Candidatus Fonsibacter sp.]